MSRKLIILIITLLITLSACSRAEEQPTAPPAETDPPAGSTNDSGQVYVPGFGWIENQGPNHADYAADMYENGNKIGIMG